MLCGRSDLAINGCQAFDCVIEKEVLIVPFILCHLGDAPMHAEITNTLNPSNSLNPCRICTLNVRTKAEKQSVSYILDFLGVDGFGVRVSYLPMVPSLGVWILTHVFTLAGIGPI